MLYLASKGSFHLVMSAAWNGMNAILDRRAKTLSSYAGDTALPGGRIDDDDKTIEDTAVRLDASSCLSDCNTVGP
jgi:8-oxo-dGTP pyrophosphatase MutT (NUDIX family)